MEVPVRPARTIRLAAIVICLVGIAGVAAGCGDDDGDEETSAAADPTAVTVTAQEFSFELSATPTAETKTITFDNGGELAHAMVFARINEGFTVDEAIKLEGGKGSAVEVAQAAAKPGEQETVNVKGPIEPGEYAMLCPIVTQEGAHYDLGQLEEFSIE
jgi:plastocyanin